MSVSLQNHVRGKSNTLNMTIVSEYLNVNWWKNEDDGEYDTSVFKTGHFAINDCNKLTMIVFTPSKYHHENQFSGEFILIPSTEKNLNVLNLSELFNIMCLNNHDQGHKLSMTRGAWGKKEINKITQNLIKIMDPQISQLLNKVLFYRNNKIPRKVIYPRSEQKSLHKKLLKTPDPPPSRVNLFLERTPQLPLAEESPSPQQNSGVNGMYSQLCPSEESTSPQQNSGLNGMYSQLCPSEESTSPQQNSGVNGMYSQLCPSEESTSPQQNSGLNGIYSQLCLSEESPSPQQNSGVNGMYSLLCPSEESTSPQQNSGLNGIYSQLCLSEESPSPQQNSGVNGMYSLLCPSEESRLPQLNSGPIDMYSHPYPSGESPSPQLDSDEEVPHLRLRLSSDKTYHPLQAVDRDTGSQKQGELGQTTSLMSLYSSHKLPVAMRSTSLLPNFMDVLGDENYNPFEHRSPTHPTTDLDTFIHLIKGSLGSGILAMPWAFKTAGLLFGLFATCLVGFICAYCVHILVKCSHILCRKLKVACLGFDDIAEVAFFAGPPQTKKYAKLGRFTVNLFLVVDLLGCCCCYVVFVGKNVKQVLDVHMDKEIDLRICMLCTLPLFVVVGMIPHLKWLAPLSMVANLLMALGMMITFYYIITDLPSPTTRPQFSSVGQLPMFFGTCIFALEGIGVIMPLENNMKTPQHFLPCFGVLNLGLGFVIMLYACLGFLGYLRYGDATQASITLNLPDSYLAQAVKSMIAIAIFLTYALQFHVPLEIIWKGIKHYFPRNQCVAQYILRISLIIMTVMISVAIPHLGPIISLVGALCLSFLGLLFPAIVEILVRWNLGYGFAKWILWKNIGLILFGLLGFFTGSYVSILDIIAESKKMD